MNEWMNVCMDDCMHELIKSWMFVCIKEIREIAYPTE